MLADEQFASTQLYDLFSQRSINWCFKPPSTPNFGDLWETGVKSVRNLLQQLIHDISHTFEEYCTLLVRIEVILDSRPLGRCSVDPGFQYLTPEHFLTGSPLLCCPEEVFINEESCRNRWDQLKRLHQAFWKRWRSEYLQTLQIHSNWTKSLEPLIAGDIVFLTGFSSNPLE